MSNGPMFEPGPGWGAKIGAWTRSNLAYVIPGIAVIVLIIILAATGGNNVSDLKIAPTAPLPPNVLPPGTITQTVQVRDSYTMVSRRAISAYVGTTAVNETAGQRLYAETILQSQIKSQPLAVGGTITFQASAIQTILDGYATLYASQKTKWEAMSSRVKF